MRLAESFLDDESEPGVELTSKPIDLSLKQKNSSEL